MSHQSPARLICDVRRKFMIWNIALIFLVFAAAKKKFSPYAACAVLGGAKSVLYFLAYRSVIMAGLAFIIFGGLAVSMVYFLSRVDKKEETEEPYSNYGSKRKTKFKWESVPLYTSIFLLIFGELTVTMLFI